MISEKNSFGAVTDFAFAICMENHNALVNEYLELLGLLNKTNKLPNEKTILRYIIEKDQNMNTLIYFSVNSDKKLLMFVLNSKRKWIAAGSTKFFDLEQHYIEYLNNPIKQNYKSILETLILATDLIFTQ